MFVLTLLGAVLSILLPGLHFITVPLGVLASPFVGMYVFLTRKGAVKRTAGEFSCPECQASNDVAFRGSPSYFVNCVQCQHSLQVAPLL
jgi:Zn ribbon nucleic-acid-binding protein